MSRIRRDRAWLAVAIAASVALSACGTTAATSRSASPEATSVLGSASSGPSGSSADPVEAGGIAEHVHNLVMKGEDLFLGTHEGVFKQSPGQQLEQISEQPFDVMGLTRSGELWLASGHPGEGMDAPGDLGLLTSSDGVAWQPRALSGQVDFHRLAASGDVVLGLSAQDGTLLRSSDGGTTWSELGRPPLFDIAVSGSDPSVVVATTPDGPVASSDGGATFSSLEGAPLVALLAWDGNDLFGIDPAGTVLVSTDDGRSWIERGSVPGQPMAIAAQQGNVAVLVDGVVQFSSD